MAGTTQKKRSRDDASKSKAAPPLKKQKKKAPQKQQARDESDDDDAQEFQAVNLLDSDDDDIHNAQVDDGGDSGSDADSIGSASSSEDERPKTTRKKPARPQPIARDVPANKLARDAPGSKPKSSGWDDQGNQSEDDDEEDDNDEYSDLDASDLSSDDGGHSGDGEDAQDDSKLKRTSKSKRNDPEAFSTSISKILGTKISGKNRADPVLARSADARERSRQVLDGELDRRARKKMREQKRLAMEKGRVRDVLVATNATFSNVNPRTGEVVVVADGMGGETTAEILATEKRLRKVAQRGVVQLFNAFRTAQVKAAEAERVARKQGVIGMDNKKDKVTEMSKKGFLDLIASGGGGLKKGPMEEA